MSDDPVQILMKRLAAGDISIDEYRILLPLLKASPTDQPQPFLSSDLDPLGQKLAQVDDIELYEACLLVAGRQYLLSNVKSVRGARSSSSVNFIPIDRLTTLNVWFTNNENVSVEETRLMFGGSRHKAILQMLTLLWQVTFKPRLQNLATRLRNEGSVELNRTIVGAGDAVSLTKDGVVAKGARRIDLKQAKAFGTFCVGTERRSLSGSRASNPNEIVVSEKKGLLGVTIPSDALRFYSWDEDPDIVQALLEWMAEPDNKL